MSLDEEFLVI